MCQESEVIDVLGNTDCCLILSYIDRMIYISYSSKEDTARKTIFVKAKESSRQTKRIESQRSLKFCPKFSCKNMDDSGK